MACEERLEDGRACVLPRGHDGFHEAAPEPEVEGLAPGQLAVHRSDLEKVRDALSQATRHHRARDEMNAALHLAERARLSPLTSELEAAFERVDELLG